MFFYTFGLTMIGLLKGICVIRSSLQEAKSSRVAKSQVSAFLEGEMKSCVVCFVDKLYC